MLPMSSGARRPSIGARLRELDVVGIQGVYGKEELLSRCAVFSARTCVKALRLLISCSTEWIQLAANACLEGAVRSPRAAHDNTISIKR